RDGHVTGVQTCALPIFSTRTRSDGTPARGNVLTQFLNVIIPENEKYAPIRIPASNSVAPELNECSTTGAPVPASIAATSASASRACTTTGLPSSTARAS